LSCTGAGAGWTGTGVTTVLLTGGGVLISTLVVGGCSPGVAVVVSLGVPVVSDGAGVAVVVSPVDGVVAVAEGGVIVVVAPLGAVTVAPGAVVSLGPVMLVLEPAGAFMVAPGVVTVVEPVSAFAADHPSATKLAAINESFLMTPLPNTLLGARAPMWVPTVDLAIALQPTSDRARP
jgi:hypothetical protein